VVSWASAARRFASASFCALSEVEFALRDRVLGQQALGPLELALREAQVGLRGHDLRRRAVDVGLVGRRVDRDQQVAGLDQRAFAEMHAFDRAGDARTDVHALDGFEATRELVPRRHVALDDGRDRDGRRLRGGCRRGGGRGGAQHEHGGDDRGNGRQRRAGNPESAAGLERNLVHLELLE